MASHPVTTHSTVYLPRTTVLAAVAFLDAFQKVADMATNTRGGEGAWSEVGDEPSGPGGWKGIWAMGRIQGLNGELGFCCDVMGQVSSDRDETRRSPSCCGQTLQW
jgi:hypothetical protein